MVAQDREPATGSNTVVLGHKLKGVAEGGGDEEEMADVDEEENPAVEARDVMMAETETATRTVTDSEAEIETGALPHNELRDLESLR